MIAISVNPEKKTVTETNSIRGRTIWKQHSGTLGTIVLAIRRPGWLFCREQALALTVLAAQQDIEKEFGIIGVLKEIVDEKGVMEFNDKFFPYPLYCDKMYAFYHALGDRKVGASFVLHPKSIVGLMCETYSRMTSNELGGMTKGEGLTLGGIVIFETTGKSVYAYEEELGKDLPVKDLLAVIHSMRRDKAQYGV